MHGRRDWTRESLAEGVRTGDRRALARAISLVENGDPLAYDLVRDIYPETGRTYAVGIAAAAVAPNVWFSLPCFVLAGIGNGIAVVCNSLLVQRGAPDAIRGRVFTVIMSVNYAVYGLGFVIAGPLTDSVGPRWVFGGVGVVLALASFVAYALTRGAEQGVGRAVEAEAA